MFDCVIAFTLADRYPRSGDPWIVYSIVTAVGQNDVQTMTLFVLIHVRTL